MGECMTRSTGRSLARRRAIGLVVLALLTGIARGADGQPPDPAAATPGVRLFTGGRVIVGDGRVIEDAAFLVRGDLIVRVGNAGEVPAPPEASVVDLTGRTVMPALVNTHAHLGWERYTSWGSGELHPREPRRPSAPPRLLRRGHDHLHRQRPRGDRPRGPAGAAGGRGRRGPLPGVARFRDPRRRTEPPVHERRRVVGAARGDQPGRGARGGAGRGRARHPDPEDLGGRA